LNLTGVDRARLARGDALVRAGQWTVTTVVDTALTVVGRDAMRSRARFQAYVGSAEHTVAFRVLDPGRRYARIEFTVHVALALVPTGVLDALRERAHALVLARGGTELATLASSLAVDPADLGPLVALDARLVVERGRVRLAGQVPITESSEAIALLTALDASP